MNLVGSELLAVVFLVLLIVVRSMLPGLGQVSEFELRRRVKVRDGEAIREARLREVLPALKGIQFVTSALLTVVIVSLTVNDLGFWVGGVASLVALIMVEFAVRQRWFDGLSQKIFTKNEKILLRFARKLKFMKRFAPASSAKPHPAFYSHEELIDLLERDKQMLSPEAKLLLTQALRYSAATIADIMTPKKKIKYITADETLGPIVIDGLHQKGHREFPVLNKEETEVVGMLRMQDVLPLNPKIKSVAQLVHPPQFVRGDWPLEQLLHAGLQTEAHLFIVVNELQETIGVATLSDAFKSLFGREIISGFDQYADLAAVAHFAAPARQGHTANDKSK